MWAVGVLLYFLLSHQFPFCGRDLNEIKHRVLKGHYNQMEGFPWDELNISPATKDLIIKLLVKDP